MPPRRRSLLVVAGLVIPLAACSDGTGAGASLDGRWYGEFAEYSVALELRSDGEQVTGTGWVDRHNTSGPAAYYPAEPILVAGTRDGHRVVLTLTKRFPVDGFVNDFTATGTRAGDRLDLSLVPGPMPLPPLASTLGTVRRTNVVLGDGLIEVTVSGAPDPSLNGTHVTAAVGRAAFEGTTYSAGSTKHEFMFHSGAGRPAVGSHRIGTNGGSSAVEALIFANCDGPDGTYCRGWVPDGPEAGTLVVSTSTDRALEGTFRFRAVYREASGQTSGAPMTVEGRLSVPCDDECR